MIRVRLYKTVPTPLGQAEITLLDTPLDPNEWTPKEQRQFDDLVVRCQGRGALLGGD